MSLNPLRFVAAPTTVKTREERVAEAAYFLALKRGFVPVYEEKGTWLVELKEKAAAADQAKLTARYAEEYKRCVGTDTP